ncbi:MAG: GNAT family N-acetyltransferase [Chloroflexota bacterium]
MTTSSDVDAILAALPADVCAALEQLRGVIAAAAPEAVESVAYGVPAFKYRGRPLVSFGAGKNHCAFYVQSPAVMDAHRGELAGLDTAKGTIRFTPDTPLPDALVTRLVRARIAETDGPRVRRLATIELTPADVSAIRALLEDAFGPDEDERFTDDDWDHAVGGVHFMLDVDGETVAHASVVERSLQIAGRPVRTGYVEAVAVAPDHQRAGYGSMLMTGVTSWIAARFELGALGTGRHPFYERLGWQTWHGPSSVRAPEGTRRTPDEDGYILVLSTPTSPPFDLTDPISCDWRTGDVW